MEPRIWRSWTIKHEVCYDISVNGIRIFYNHQQKISSRPIDFQHQQNQQYEG
jgi:hypothetical protein